MSFTPLSHVSNIAKPPTPEVDVSHSWNTERPFASVLVEHMLQDALPPEERGTVRQSMPQLRQRRLLSLGNFRSAPATL